VPLLARFFLPDGFVNRRVDRFDRIELIIHHVIFSS